MNLFAPVAVSSDVPAGDGERLPASVVKILDGALRAISSRGVRRLSMSDISVESGVSRATLYRYFPTKEQVLAAVSEFVSMGFEGGVREAAEQHPDPIERFRAVMRFFAQFTVERTPERIFELEPGFHLDFFRSHFARHKTAVRDALAPSFDHLDRLRSAPVDRDAIVEALVRMQLSTLIVPASPAWSKLWEATPDVLQQTLLHLADSTNAIEEN